MKVTTWGTRGSTAVAGPLFVKYGGNTTSLEIRSSCLPPKTALIIDAGTGIVPLTENLIKEKIEKIILLFTHFHHDHTQGLLMAPTTFIKDIQIHAYGPVDNGYDARGIMEIIMKPPFFPVDFKEVGSHFHFISHRLEHPSAMVMIIHPKSGLKVMNLDQFERLTNSNRQIPFDGKSYGVEECLVIKMYRSNHPERTISYRFEERPTNKVFCFLTDHENTDALPQALKRHLHNADLLIQDSQYSRKMYDMTAGWGHGTPDYCAKIAVEVGAKKLGLTHHDPNSSDEDIDKIVMEAEKAKEKAQPKHIAYFMQIFACRDYQETEI
ncbi:MAG: MBL fold metallo-hydrolase [Patescibacteria group bacterium]|jgi:ribonuclease BN (tRNA processing enzyme)